MYGFGPGFVPWTTLPEIRTRSVLTGTPWSSAARLTVTPLLTALTAAAITSSAHCLRLVRPEEVRRTAGADKLLFLERKLRLRI